MTQHSKLVGKTPALRASSTPHRPVTYKTTPGCDRVTLPAAELIFCENDDPADHWSVCWVAETPALLLRLQLYFVVHSQYRAPVKDTAGA